MKTTVQEYREDLGEILDGGLDYFINHCLDDRYSEFGVAGCLLDESEHDEVIRRVNTFRLEMEAFIAKAKVVAQQVDYYSPPEDSPENTDISGLLARIRQGPPAPS